MSIEETNTAAADVLSQAVSEPTPSLLEDEQVAQVEANAEFDAGLRATWDKIHSPERQEKDFLKEPPMPALPAEMSEQDRMAAVWKWNHTPLKERQNIARANRGIGDLQKAAEGFGFKIESAADVKAAQELLGTKPAEIDADTKEALDTFKKIMPDAKDHKEASTMLGAWADHIASNPKTGWRDLLKTQGITAMDLLDETELAQLTGRQGQSDYREPNVVTMWRHSRGIGEEDAQELAEIIQGRRFKHIAGEPYLNTLDRAAKVMRANRERNPKGAANKKMDDALRTIAAKHYGSQQ